MELISDAGEGDTILVDQIDRLAGLKQADWEISPFDSMPRPRSLKLS